jgi:hypothetical protein
MGVSADLTGFGAGVRLPRHLIYVCGRGVDGANTAMLA